MKRQHEMSNVNEAIQQAETPGKLASRLIEGLGFLNASRETVTVQDAPIGESIDIQL
jgi:hypothetical protein